MHIKGRLYAEQKKYILPLYIILQSLPLQLPRHWFLACKKSSNISVK